MNEVRGDRRVRDGRLFAGPMRSAGAILTENGPLPARAAS